MRMTLRLMATCLVLHVVAAAHPLVAQKRVTLDLGKRAFTTDTLPFGEPFTVVADVDSGVKAVAIHYGIRRDAAGFDIMEGREIGCHPWIRDQHIGLDSASTAGQKSAAVDFPVPLRANRKYLFRVMLYRLPPGGAMPLSEDGSGPAVIGCADLDRLRRTKPNRLLLLTDSFSVRGETPTDYKQRFDNDVGIVHTDRFGYTGFVSDLHYYFTPINKNEDLGDPELGLGGQLVRRVSVMAGLAVKLDSRSEVDNVLSFGTPMAGIGIRGPLYWPSTKPHSPQYRSFFQPMRLNVGIIWFKQKDANPLSSATHIKRDLFVSLTADVALKTVLGPFASVFK